ncbi:MAG: 16S rRNA (cytosine(1402)-N(4))-methyltransferase RsmH [Desulfobacterales bacterium]|nr:16S rRNA (cytosine(1402)-N(4))-methyltransferase RsmH [Desulfobacterales bacterium]
MGYQHVPVMCGEALHYLNCEPNKIYIDATLGGAGHAKAIAQKILPDGLLIGIDQDKDAIEHGYQKLHHYKKNIHLVHDNFVHISKILNAMDIQEVDGILLDAGISRDQLESSGRGFSFKLDEPLDMRMNKESGITADEIINTSDEETLCRFFFEYGEERYSRCIARAIIKMRQKKRIGSSRQLSDIVCSSVPARAYRNQKIHPATRIFMALRILVNNELKQLDTFMSYVSSCLKPKGRLCVITFHSLEDRIVKQHLKRLSIKCQCPSDFPICVCKKKPEMNVLTTKVVLPKAAEIASNPMSRSAKLRAAEKVDN